MNKPRYKRPAAIDLGDLHVSIVRGPNTEGRWYWRARDADRATVWTGWATRDEAAREGAAILAKPQAPTTPKHGLKTFTEVIIAWRDIQRARVELAPYTHTNRDHRVQHLVQHLGERSVARVTRDVLEGYVRARLAEGGSLRTIHGELTSLGHAWRVATERGLIAYGVLPKLSLRIDPKVFTINHRTPTSEEVSLALAKLPAEEALTVQLLAATGARIGEVLALRRDQIHPTRGVLILDGKTGPREFPLTPGLLALIEDRLDGTDAPLIQLPVNNPQQRVRCRLGTACRRASVPEFTPHALRRLAVDRMARAGVEPSVAASITGHDPIVMLKHYRVVSEDDLRAAAKRADLGWVLRLSAEDSA
jgi:integrase